jgi:hypothetical protein
VCEHLMQHYGIEKEEVKHVKQEKEEKFWGFAMKWILEEEEILIAC